MGVFSWQEMVFSAVFGAAGGLVVVLCYLARPEIKPRSDMDRLWDLLSPHAKAVAMDQDGEWWWYPVEPYIARKLGYWDITYTGGGAIRDEEVLKILTATSRQWDESLIERPTP